MTRRRRHPGQQVEPPLSHRPTRNRLRVEQHEGVQTRAFLTCRLRAEPHEGDRTRWVEPNDEG